MKIHMVHHKHWHQHPETRCCLERDPCRVKEDGQDWGSEHKAGEVRHRLVLHPDLHHLPQLPGPRPQHRKDPGKRACCPLAAITSGLVNGHGRKLMEAFGSHPIKLQRVLGIFLY